MASSGRSFGSIGLAISDFVRALASPRRRRGTSAGLRASERDAILSACKCCFRLMRLIMCDIEEAIPDHAGSGFRHAACARACRRNTQAPRHAARRSRRRISTRSRPPFRSRDRHFNSGGVVVDGGCKDTTARSADRQQNTVPGRMADRAGSRSKTLRRARRRGKRGFRSFAALCRRRCGAHLPPCPNAGTSGPRGSRSHVLWRPQSRRCRPSSVRILHRCKVDTHSPVAKWPRPWKYSKVKARWASAKAHGDLPAFAFARSRSEAKRLIDIARNDPRCRAVDICACKGINRGAKIEADAVAVMPNS